AGRPADKPRDLLEVRLDSTVEKRRVGDRVDSLDDLRKVHRHGDNLLAGLDEGADGGVVPDAVLAVEVIAGAGKDLDDLHPDTSIYTPASSLLLFALPTSAQRLVQGHEAEREGRIALRQLHLG